MESVPYTLIFVLLIPIYFHFLQIKGIANFHAFHLFDDLPQPDPDFPLLLIPNHSTWWDGFFIYLLNEEILKRETYLMMLDRQLAKYKFFSRIGAFGITPGDRKNVIESLNYTVELLQKSNIMITIFPQGILLPWDKRPLNFKKGIESIIKRYGKPVNIMPLAIRAEYGGEQRAEVFFQFGENFIVDARTFQGIKWLEQVELNLLDDMAERIQRGKKGRKLLMGRGSINVKMDKLFRRN